MLNDTGRALLPQARTVLDAAGALESQFVPASRTHQGARAPTRLRVAASTTIGNYVLPSLVAGFRAESPEVRVDVSIGNTSQVAQQVALLEADIGLIEGPCHEAELVAHPWREDELVIVCAPRHPLARGTRTGGRVPIAALRDAPWLLREAGSGTREAVDQILLPHLHQLRSEMECGGTEAIKQAAAAGLGITCLSACAVEDFVAWKKLVVLNTTLKRLVRRFYLVHHRQKRFSDGLRQFAEFAGVKVP